MTTQATEALRYELTIAAEPAVVFAHFTNPGRMTRWMGVRADLEARPGGRFEVDVDGEHVAIGEFVEVDPPRRVVFTWGWELEGGGIPPGGSLVEVDLAPEGNGTRLVFRHSGLPAAARPQHDDGWSHFLERLEVAGAGGDPGPDPWVRERPS